MIESTLRPQARRPLVRKGSYVVLAIAMGTVGIFAIRWGIEEQKFHYILSGTALPFIFVIGEMIRNCLYFRKFQTARCRKCKHDFPFADLLKTGRCPECRSRNIVGLRVQKRTAED